MGTKVLGIGQSALLAAQQGIAVAGHNIANVNTPGYTRQELLLSANAPQAEGGSFFGQGTQVGQVRRVYNEFIAQQVNYAQSTSNYSSAYLSQIQQVSNLTADTTAGISPSMRDLFSSLQNLSSTPNGTAGAAARQSVLSAGATLVSRFQSLSARLDQMAEDVNGRITKSIDTINVYARQIADLNKLIEAAKSASNGAEPNDLLDQRDLAVTELSKQINVSVVEQNGNYNIFIGTGQAIVLGEKLNLVQGKTSLTDPSRIEAAYESNGQLIPLNEKNLTGGELGGLFAFRSGTLDLARNSLGRVAITLASEFNEQHRLGQDLNGDIGQDFFKYGNPVVYTGLNNTSATQIKASFTNTSQLTTSDYRVQYLNGGAGNFFRVTRMADGVTKDLANVPIEMDGVRFELGLNNALPPVAVVPNVGDEFLVKPTVAGASTIKANLTDINKIAAGLPVTTNMPTTNLGTGKFNTGKVDVAVAAFSNSATAFIGNVDTDASFNPQTLNTPLNLTYTASNGLSGFPLGSYVSVVNAGVTTNYKVAAVANPVAVPPEVTEIPYASGATINYAGINFQIKNNPTAPVAGNTFTLTKPTPVTPIKLTYDGTTNSFSGFPVGANVSVTNAGVTTNYVAGSSIPYVEGSTMSFNGMNFNVSGKFTNGDVVNIVPNTNGTGDNRNALGLNEIQTKNLVNGTTTLLGSFSQFVSAVGNKANELSVTNAAEKKLLDNAIKTQQSEGGVNLDEEAANLLRYQQAYQAAGKLMQISSQLFDALLNLGR